MNSAWRIVEDPNVASARKRKAQGLRPLQQGRDDPDVPEPAGPAEDLESNIFLVEFQGILS